MRFVQKSRNSFNPAFKVACVKHKNIKQLPYWIRNYFHNINSSLQSCSPRYLRDLSTFQLSRSTRSFTLATLLQPVDSSLKVTNRSFLYDTPHLCKRLPPTLRAPYQFDPSSSSFSSSPSSCSDPGPLVGLSHGVFRCRLKIFLFSKSFPP